ncbi:hypothetical protein QR680_001382 [Steinernema hermaphroditum]|uniref:Uncharacterized protein n=1 Tax=Steinernema hermaphroditum TaxID=289476 RepID=A0AA39GYX0_9BILA|nr:hypothetical protein QR680_001382 [Steinernema hermaphroditum]
MSSSQDETPKETEGDSQVEPDITENEASTFKDSEVGTDSILTGEKAVEDDLTMESSHPQPPTIDEENGVVTVAVEDLLAAGIDVENLSTITQDELAKVIAMAKRNSLIDSSGNEDTSKKEDPERIAANIVDEVMDRPMNSCTQNPQTSQENEPWSLVVTDDGNIRLTDSHNHIYLFTREVLQTHHIDPNNLTEDNIQSLLALAMPITKLTTGEPNAKRAKLTPSSISSYALQECESHPGKHVQDFSLIGEEVEVRKDGKLLAATIRYCREGSGPNFKVQFTDGHFEWVEEDQIVLPIVKRSASSSPGRSFMATSMNADRKSATETSTRVNVGNRYEHHDTVANYCCQVCDRKVYQKEPTYIVIRIPACHSCAEKQMFILDESEVTPNRTPADEDDTKSERTKEPSFKERKTSSAPLEETYSHAALTGVIQPRSASVDCCSLLEDYATEDPEIEKKKSAPLISTTNLPSPGNDEPRHASPTGIDIKSE